MFRFSLRRLRLLLPLIAVLSAGAPHAALGLELNASNIAVRIADALKQRHLEIAQTAVNQLAACNVRHLVIDGVKYSPSRLTRIVSALASGNRPRLMPAPKRHATFILEDGNRPVAVCVIEEAHPVSEPTTHYEPPPPPPPPPDPYTPPPLA